MDCTGICRCGPCSDCVPEEHRGSRMPPHMESVDPLFHDAAMREFEPESPGEREALLERMGIVVHGGK